jgi:hypothetical protein
MFYCPEKYIIPVENVNEKFLKLEGDLTDKEAKLTLIEFLRANIGLTVEILSGIKLAPYQEIALKAMLNRNYSMCVWGRGVSKSFLAAVASFIIPVFEPNSHILVAGPTFRTARQIFGYLERMVNTRNAELLQQIFAEKSKRADLFEWKVTDGNYISTIRAIPLNGEKIRGFRANTLILDEFLLLSEDIIKNVLMPFLTAPMDISERQKIREKEDRLIASGEMTEADRQDFTDTTRMIALSSASYSFEYLYRVYKEWIDNVTNNEPVGPSKYFVSQLSYEAIPKYMISQTIIEEARGSDETHPSFKREYCAQFVDGSESYFSAKRMLDQTIKDGEYPTTMVYGDPNKKYLLSIDPSFSSSPTSDYFAMAVSELNDENMEEASFTLVHNYAVAGGELKEHIRYFLYLLKSFNICYIIADNADGNFIQSANESELFKSEKIEIKFIDYDGNLKGDEYAEMLRVVKNQYNKNDNRIAFKHVFNQDSIRRMNEQLQTLINRRKVWFSSKLSAHSHEFDKAIKFVGSGNFSYDLRGRDIGDFVAEQDDLIYQVKKQCSLIEVRVTPTGNQTFDLPQLLKRDTSVNRARKDNYTALLLSAEVFKAHIDISTGVQNTPKKMANPIMFGRSTMTRK